MELGCYLRRGFHSLEVSCIVLLLTLKVTSRIIRVIHPYIIVRNSKDSDLLFCKITSKTKLVKGKSNENMIDSYTIVKLFPRCQ